MSNFCMRQFLSARKKWLYRNNVLQISLLTMTLFTVKARLQWHIWHVPNDWFVWLQWQCGYSNTFPLSRGCHCKQGRLNFIRCHYSITTHGQLSESWGCTAYMMVRILICIQLHLDFSAAGLFRWCFFCATAGVLGSSRVPSFDVTDGLFGADWLRSRRLRRFRRRRSSK